MTLDPRKQETVLRLLSEGWSYRRAAEKAGVSLSSVQRLVKKATASPSTGNNKDTLINRKIETLPGPIPLDKLSKEAARGLEDFAYFERRYLGRVSSPWRKEAAEKMARLLETENEEYVVVNAPPGVGKTTLFTHDIPVWLTCRNRAIRGLIGSATQRAAQTHVNRIKRTLMRPTPEKADLMAIRRGFAFDAEACLAMEYGRFQPLDKELWNRDGIIVMQHEEYGSISEKEATWSAYGEDAGFIGQRFTFVMWDDLVTPKSVSTVEAREKQQTHWSTVAETRLEPGGVLVLQGQRLAPEDLYRYALDLRSGEFDDDDVEYNEEGQEIVDDRGGKKYHHIVFKAHYEDNCKGDGMQNPNHNPKSCKAWPEGCLLEPTRLPYKKIRMLEQNPVNNFRTVYQQEDVDPANVLVQMEWISGSERFPGCWDKDRDLWELPPGVDTNGLIICATADPSPTMYWSVQAWAYDPVSELRYFLAMHRAKMEAPQFLDFNVNTGEWTGLMAQWQEHSRRMGVPIQTWIVEQNAAARFLLQYDHVRRWQAKNGVDILPHTTGRNKTDPEYGVQTIAPHYRYGRIRLPSANDARTQVMQLVKEVTTYPHGRTDDCVMAQWFFEWNLPSLHSPNSAPAGKPWRPSWVA